MSQPKRYVATYDDGFVTNEYREECKSDKLDCNNIWVKAEDYAVLAAENERLRKAGDAMYAAAVQDSTGLWVLKPFQDWKAAKEGS